MSISVIPLSRAAVALEVGGMMTDISSGVRAARLAVGGLVAAYHTLESGWARQMEAGRRGALVLTVSASTDANSAYAYLRDWLLVGGGARDMTLTQGAVVYGGSFRLLGLSPLAEAQAGSGSSVLAQARLVLDGALSMV